MKVISKPDFSDWKSTCKCWQCSSELEIVPDDLRVKNEKKYSSDDGWGGGGSYMEEVFYVICPVCDKHIEIKNTFPYLMAQYIRKKKG